MVNMDTQNLTEEIDRTNTAKLQLKIILMHNSLNAPGI